MCRKYAVSAIIAPLTAMFIFAALPAEAYRICTFKGTVIDHGWRSMTVKSGTQCAEVNVGWRTKYVPNRRPCLGERVAVDFTLEDGYMKATKIVSLTPLPPSVQCYPPPPPSSAVCRTVPDDEAAIAPEGPCQSPRAVCSNRPPAHVTDRAWSPMKSRSEATPRAVRQAARKPAPERETAKPTPEPKEKPPVEPPAPPEDQKAKTLTGEVVASTPKSLSIKVRGDETDGAEMVNIRVGLRTKFTPFRRPAVGEKVQVEYKQENGEKFGHTVKVVEQ
jgi:hypothetical protein